MKKITYSLAIAATILATTNTYAQHGIGTNTPHRSAALHIESTNKGLLIPRVVLTDLAASAPIMGTPPNSLMVYHTGGSTIPAGFYYWQTNKWIPFATGNEIADLEGKNGISRVDNFFKLGGTLEDDDTIINFGGKSFTLDLTTANSKFILRGLVEIQSSSENTVPNMDLVVYSNQPNQIGQVFRYGPNKLFKDYLIGVNGIKVEYNEFSNQTEVLLGGTIDRETNFNITENGSIKVSGLEHIDGPLPTAISGDTQQGQAVADLEGNLVAVGNSVTGELKVATAQDIVNAGIVTFQHEVTESVINEGGTVTEGSKLKTIINGTEVTNEIDLTEIVLKEQKTYNVVSPDNSLISVTPVIDHNLTTFTIDIDAGDIVAAGISADNGLTLTGDNVVELGGTLLKPTVITTNTTTEGVATMNTLAIAGLQNANVGAHKNVTVDETGVLRTTDRIATTADTNAEQVVLSVALTGNQNLVLTQASAGVLGQVVNVIITSSDEEGTLYITGEGTHLTGLSDLGYEEVPNNVLAIGGLEGQKFTFKCVAKDNSYAWEVVSRN